MTLILAFLAGVGVTLAALHIPIKKAIAELKADVASVKSGLADVKAKLK